MLAALDGSSAARVPTPSAVRDSGRGRAGDLHRAARRHRLRDRRPPRPAHRRRARAQRPRLVVDHPPGPGAAARRARRRGRRRPRPPRRAAGRATAAPTPSQRRRHDQRDRRSATACRSRRCSPRTASAGRRSSTPARPSRSRAPRRRARSCPPRPRPRAAPAPRRRRPARYTVAAGDTISAIAQRHGVSMQAVLTRTGSAGRRSSTPARRIAIPRGIRRPRGDTRRRPALHRARRRAGRERAAHHQVGRELGVPDRGHRDRARHRDAGVLAAQSRLGRPRLARPLPAAPEHGWGTPEEVRDPVRAARAFYGGPVRPERLRHPRPARHPRLAGHDVHARPRRRCRSRPIPTRTRSGSSPRIAWLAALRLTPHPAPSVAPQRGEPLRGLAGTRSVDSQREHESAGRPADRPSRRRPIPGSRAHRARRHGDRVRGHRPAARAPDRAQGDARPPERRHRVPEPVHPGGARRRPPRRPARRQRVRPGPGRRHGLPGHGVPARASRCASCCASSAGSRCRRRSRSWTRSSPGSPPRTAPASCTATSSPRTCCSPRTAASRSATSGSRAPRRANTATGAQLLGTIAYLAPELVTRGMADARSDIYSLGIMLYEMLVGEQPYKGEQPMQIAFQHATDSVPRPERQEPGRSRAARRARAVGDREVARRPARRRARDARPAARDRARARHRTRRSPAPLSAGIIRDEVSGDSGDLTAGAARRPMTGADDRGRRRRQRHAPAHARPSAARRKGGWLIAARPAARRARRRRRLVVRLGPGFAGRGRRMSASRSFAEAQQILAEQSLVRPSRRTCTTSTSPAGVVVGTEPPAGSRSTRTRGRTCSSRWARSRRRCRRSPA